MSGGIRLGSLEISMSQKNIDCEQLLLCIRTENTYVKKNETNYNKCFIIDIKMLRNRTFKFTIK